MATRAIRSLHVWNARFGLLYWNILLITFTLKFEVLEHVEYSDKVAEWVGKLNKSKKYIYLIFNCKFIDIFLV